jgi:pyruvate/2-oxoglutarate dehydrogenase complex dihydrolipoamide dehydrogenase (E3) component
MPVEAETAIIGAGQAGVPLARALADAGRTVTLIEARHLGGSCVNFGCTPSKTMIASARLAAQARRATEWGIRIPSVEVDFAAMMERTCGIVKKSTDSLDGSFAGSDNPRLVKAWGNSKATSVTSSTPTTLAAGSRHPRASPLTNLSAKPGQMSPNCSSSIRSTKCRD